MIDSVFLLSVVTIFSGIIGLIIRYTFRSKCSNINCCFGLCQIKRDIQREVEVEQAQANAKGPVSDLDKIELGTSSPKSRVGFTD
jgi:hypothetical protein